MQSTAAQWARLLRVVDTGTLPGNISNHFHNMTYLPIVYYQGRIQGVTRRAPPPLKLEKNMIFWRKIVIFHTKYLKKDWEL